LQDKLVDIELGATTNITVGVMRRPVPAIVVVPDYMDAPYGHIHEPTTNKASHLALHPGMVQQTDALLATTAINALDTLDGFVLNSSAAAPRGKRWTSLSTSVVLPTAAGHVWILPAAGTGAGAGAGVAAAAAAVPAANAARLAAMEKFVLPTAAGAAGDVVPFTRTLQVGDTIGLSVGRGAVALRVFQLDGASGQAPALLLSGEAEGLTLGAFRLVGYHWRPAAGAENGYEPDARDTAVRWGGLFKAGAVPAAQRSGEASESEASGAGAGAGTEVEDGDAVVRRLVAEVAAAAIANEVAQVNPNSRVWVASAALASAVPAAVWQRQPGASASAPRQVPALLSVERNLTCSTDGGPRNQSAHTAWNCLLSRAIDGQAVVPGHLTINGQLAPQIPEHIAALKSATAGSKSSSD
jgi:hypothetical protein